MKRKRFCKVSFLVRRVQIDSLSLRFQWIVEARLGVSWLGSPVSKHPLEKEKFGEANTSWSYSSSHKTQLVDGEKTVTHQKSTNRWSHVGFRCARIIPSQLDVKQSLNQKEERSMRHFLVCTLHFPSPGFISAWLQSNRKHSLSLNVIVDFK